MITSLDFMLDCFGIAALSAGGAALVSAVSSARASRATRKAFAELVPPPPPSPPAVGTEGLADRLVQFQGARFASPIVSNRGRSRLGGTRPTRVIPFPSRQRPDDKEPT